MSVNSPASTIASLPVLASEPLPFHCPGERHPISRAVHLSRLASFYPGCRECTHRQETGPLSQSRLRQLDQLATRRAPRDVIAAEGVRGVYPNDLTRETATRLAEAIASGFWKGHIRRGRDEDSDREPTAHPGPRIALARDNRPSAPDVAAGVAIGLRRMGCHVVDVGLAGGPALDFAVYHLRLDGGVRVTGALQPAAWTGLDVIDGNGVPWSSPGRLDSLRTGTPAARHTRTGGTLESFDILPPRRALLLRHAHALKAVRFGLQVDDPVERERLPQLLGDLLPSAHLVETSPFRPRDAWSREDRRRCRDLIRARELTFLFVVGEDGRVGSLIDEQGRVIDSQDWLVRLAEFALGGNNRPRVVLSSNVSPISRGRLKAHGNDVQSVGASREELIGEMLRSKADLAADGEGRVWFGDHYPLGDGLVALLHLLRLAGQTRQPISQWSA